MGVWLGAVQFIKLSGCRCGYAMAFPFVFFSFKDHMLCVQRAANKQFTQSSPVKYIYIRK